MEQLFTVKEVSEYLKVTEQAVYKYIKEGRIKASHLASKGTWRIKESDINNFMFNNQNQNNNNNNN